MAQFEDEIERKRRESKEDQECDLIEHSNLKTSIMKEDVKIINGVGETIAEKLRESGFDTVKKIANTTVAQLSSIRGIGEAMAQKIIDEANSLISLKSLSDFSGDKKELIEPHIENLEKRSEEEEDDEDFEGEVMFEELKPLNNVKKLLYEERTPSVIQPIETNVVEPKSSPIQEEQMDNSQKKAVLERILAIFQIHKYHIIETSQELQKLYRLVDLIAFKTVHFNELMDIILLFPLTINVLNGKMQISNEQIKYTPNHQGFKEDGALFRILLDSYFDNLAEAYKVINEDLQNGGPLTSYLNEHHNVDVSLKKTFLNRNLFFSSGSLQIKILIEPVLLCQKEIGFMEKVIPFAYLRDTNLHAIKENDLSILLKFIEQKYTLLETHRKQDPSLISFQDTYKQFLNRIRLFSIPFIGYAALLIILLLFQSYEILDILLNIGYALFGIYIISIVYLYLKLIKQKSVAREEFSVPYHKKSIQLDETSLVLINEEFSPQMMSQFVYESLGKKSSSKLMTKIDENQMKQRIEEKQFSLKVSNGEFFEKEAVDTENPEHEFIQKYGSFLED